MTVRWSLLLIGTALAAPLGAVRAIPVDVVRDPAARVGPIAGQASIDVPHSARNVIVTQGVPAASRYSNLVINYKNALAKHFPGEASDYTSLQGFISAGTLIQALKQTTPLATERLVETLETMRSLDRSLGAKLSFGRAERQASHTIRATMPGETGTYQATQLE